MVVNLTKKVREFPRLCRGDSVFLRFDLSTAEIFDRESGLKSPTKKIVMGLLRKFTRRNTLRETSQTKALT